jgi:hypothetical protein
MTRDEQDDAETMDEEMVDGDDLTTDHDAVEFVNERPRALPFADADITDESVSERIEQEVPDVTERDIDERYADGYLGESEVDIDTIDPLEPEAD